MTLGLRKTLGLAMDERSAMVVELHVARGRTAAVRAAEFAFPEGLSLDEPARLGEALGAFLREHRFAARKAVVGIPARWLLIKEETVPLANAASIAGMLRIRAERDFSADAKDLAIDYAEGSESEQGKRLLLAATMRRKLEQIGAMAEAAGLKVRSVTSSVMTLVWAFGQSSAVPTLALHLKPNGAEMTISDGKRFRTVRHLPLAICPEPQADGGEGDWLAELVREMRREASLLPQGGDTPEPEELLVWDGVGVDDVALGALGEGLSLRVMVGAGLADIGIVVPPGVGDEEERRFVAAGALAMAGLRPELLAVDFLNSRLAVRKKKAFGKNAAWRAALATAAVAACAFALLDFQGDRRELSALQGRLLAMKDDVDAAQNVIQRTSQARGWYDRRPKFLACLQELALSFPAQGSIWATSLAMQENMHGVVSGKSGDEKAVLEVLDMFKSRGTFSDVKLLYMREAGKTSREIAFAISFTFAPVD